MTSLNQVVKKQIEFSRSEKVGTVVSSIKMIDGSSSGSSPVYAVNVDIGAERLLEDVVIKSVGTSHFYAQVGSPVLLRKNTRGLFDVVGPADRVVAVKVVKTYDFGVLVPTGTSNSGFQIEVVPYDHFQSTVGAPPGESLYGSGVIGSEYNLVRTLDGDGNPI